MTTIKERVTKISEEVEAELESLFRLNPKYRREYNKLIKNIQIDGIYPKLRILRQGKAEIYTFSNVVWVWLKYILRKEGEKQVSLIDILKRILKNEEPFVGVEFYKNLRQLLEVTAS